MVGEGRRALFLRRGEGDPALQAVDRLAVSAMIGRRAFGMNDAPPRGHPVNLAWTDRSVGPETVAMDDLAVEQEGDSGEADMGMRPYVDALAGAKFSGSEVIEEDERADHAPVDMGERAPYREVTDIHAARHHHKIDGIGGPGIAGRRIFGRKEAHADILRRRPSSPSHRERRYLVNPMEMGRTDYGTSSGSVPVGLPAASSRIFSTRASARRSNSSQRRFSASPRS